MSYGKTQICMKCGRELKGAFVHNRAKWVCSECAEDKENPIYCERGCRVEFAYPNNGMNLEREEAAKFLKRDTTYAVESVEIGGCYSWIELKELPGKRFNSVFFKRVG